MKTMLFKIATVFAIALIAALCGTAHAYATETTESVTSIAQDQQTSATVTDAVDSM